MNVCVSQIFVSYRRKLRFHFKYPAEDETSVEKILIIIQLFYMYIGFYGVLFFFFSFTNCFQLDSVTCLITDNSAVIYMHSFVSIHNNCKILP